MQCALSYLTATLRSLFKSESVLRGGLRVPFLSKQHVADAHAAIVHILHKTKMLPSTRCVYEMSKKMMSKTTMGIMCIASSLCI